MPSVTFSKIILLLLTFNAAAVAVLPYERACLLIRDVFRGSPAAKAACWSNDLIRFALITAGYNIQFCQIERERGRAGGQRRE